MHLNSDTLVLVLSCKSRPVPCLQSTALHLTSLQLSKAKDLNTYYNWYFDVPNKLLLTSGEATMEGILHNMKGARFTHILDWARFSNYSSLLQLDIVLVRTTALQQIP